MIYEILSIESVSGVKVLLKLAGLINVDVFLELSGLSIILLLYVGLLEIK